MLNADECRKNQFFADSIYNFFQNLQYNIYQITSKGEEIEIKKFELNDRENYVGMNYIAHHNINN